MKLFLQGQVNTGEEWDGRGRNTPTTVLVKAVFQLSFFENRIIPFEDTFA